MRGDEWWYRDHVLKGTGTLEFLEDPCVFSMDLTGLTAPTRFKSHDLLYTLRQTRARFTDAVLICTLTSAIEPLFYELLETDMVQWDLVKRSNSQYARISRISIA